MTMGSNVITRRHVTDPDIDRTRQFFWPGAVVVMNGAAFKRVHDVGHDIRPNKTV